MKKIKYIFIFVVIALLLIASATNERAIDLVKSAYSSVTSLFSQEQNRQKPESSTQENTRFTVDMSNTDENDQQDPRKEESQGLAKSSPQSSQTESGTRGSKQEESQGLAKSSPQSSQTESGTRGSKQEGSQGLAKSSPQSSQTESGTRGSKQEGSQGLAKSSRQSSQEDGTITRPNPSSFQNKEPSDPVFLYGAVSPTPAEDTSVGPWLTGPLIARPNYCLGSGSLHLEVFLSCVNPYGHYKNNWNYTDVHPVLSKMSLEILLQMGLVSFMDITIRPRVYYDLTGKVNQPWSVGDLAVELGFQLMGSSPFGTDPLLKIAISETLPVGKYQFLEESADGADATGGGSLITSIGFLGGKLYHLDGVHWLSTRVELEFNFPDKTVVRGKNTYGGDLTTRGTVRPGASFDFVLSGEYTVTRNFAVALDVVNVYTFKTTFDGTTTVPVGTDHNSYQLSLAPALEWNVSRNFGVIGGFFFSVAGCNSQAFANGTVALNWFY